MAAAFFQYLSKALAPTFRTPMVAASLYLRVLEEEFSDAGQMVSCYYAWLPETTQEPDRDSEDNLGRSVKWVDAHHAADRVARAWLTNPDRQSFKLHLPNSHSRLAPLKITFDPWTPTRRARTSPHGPPFSRRSTGSQAVSLAGPVVLPPSAWPSSAPRCEAPIGCIRCSSGLGLRDWKSPNTQSTQDAQPDEHP
jgi:hypothetical protein